MRMLPQGFLNKVPMTMVKSWEKTWENWGTKGLFHLIISYSQSISKMRGTWRQEFIQLSWRNVYYLWDSFPMTCWACILTHVMDAYPRVVSQRIDWFCFINYQSRKHTIILLTGQLETFSKLRLFLPKLL